MYDVVALGELLIDFIQSGENRNRTPVFEANPGGAPGNVLAMLRKLGFQVGFIGKVGKDSFGDMLAKTLKETGISDEGLVFDEEVNTTLALVHTMEDGDREFSFYRNPGADIMLKPEEVCLNMIEKCRIFHFGSLSLTDEPASDATKLAVETAKKSGKLISFDPNLRPSLWKDLKDAKDAIWYGIEKCDILKIADNEIKWLTGTEDYDEGVRRIRERSDAGLINVTLGKEGSLSYYKDKKVFADAVYSGKTVATTGAGDTFCANVLGCVLENGMQNLAEKDLKKMLLFANTAASIVTTRKGAIHSMPEKKTVVAMMEAANLMLQ